MSQEDQEKNGVGAQSTALLPGRLKHTRTAALALALVPLAAIAVSTQVNEDCPSGIDTNTDGLYELGTGPGRGEYEVLVQIPPNSTPTTPNVGTDEEATEFLMAMATA